MKKVGLLFIIVVLFFGSCKKDKKEIVKAKKPNIVYILADDLGYGDLSCYGQQKFNTPNIDQLAKEGMLFTQHYSGTTVCAPSRSSLMTGQHTGHTFIRGNKEIQPEGQYPLEASVVTLAELLKKGGYVTGGFGKWGLGYPGSEGEPNNQGFDKFYGYNCQRLSHNYYPSHLWDNQTKVILKGNSGNQNTQYAPELIHKEALAFLEKNKDTTFFMYYPSVIPHAELIVPEKYLKRYRGKLEPEKSFQGADKKFSKKGENGTYQRNGGYNSQKEAHAAFAGMISLLDDQVGEIRKKLEELGIADNTIIIFTSDNGPHKEGGADPDYFNSNGKLRGYKRDVYEGGIRVPMIAYWPGKIKANTASEHISSFWDVLPTFCEVAGVKTPENTDGISFLPELTGADQKKHDYLYWEFHERKGRQAVRMGNWKGVRLKMENNPNAPVELYDLTSDIGETNDVAKDNPEIVKKIEKIMKEAHVESPAFKFKYEKAKRKEGKQ